LEQKRWLLLDWFRTIEVRVWEIVTAHYGRRRPEAIFLVMGQTLTPEYWISHQEELCTGFEVSIEGSAGIPTFVEGKTFLGYGIEKVEASVGFEVSARKTLQNGELELYSVYFEMEPSFPTNRFNFLWRKSSRIRQIEKMYR
jgi:hypothetical protein